MYGFWVSENQIDAEYFIDPSGPRPRVLTLEMDTSNAIPWNDDEHFLVNYEEVKTLKENGVTALLGAEADTSHVVYDRSCLRLVGVEEMEKSETDWDDEMGDLDPEYY